MDINTHRAHTHKVCALLQFEEDKSLSLRYSLEIENSIISNQTIRLQIRIGICFTLAEFKGMELLLLLILLLRWYHSWGPRKTSWFSKKVLTWPMSTVANISSNQLREVLLVRAKEVYQILGIDRTKLRDYDRKYEVFTPEHERSDEKEAIDYTETDLYNLKRLVILNRATLTCTDIKEIQTGKKSLSQAFEYRAQLIRKEYEEKMASLQFAQIIAATGADYNDLDVDRLWNVMQGKEQEGVVFYMEDNDPRILERDVICPCCGERVLVDLEDYVADITSTDSQRDDDMGPDNVYEFDPDAPCECPNCYKCFTISGWLREYPIGAYDSDEIETIPYEEQ